MITFRQATMAHNAFQMCILQGSSSLNTTELYHFVATVLDSKPEIAKHTRDRSFELRNEYYTCVPCES